MRARLRGSIDSDLDWSNAATECTGAVRPDGGIRMRFSHTGSDQGERLVLVFGIAQLREGKSAKNLPVNLTLFREGSGEFYSTRGDDKCMLDEISQTPLVGIPYRERSYRVVVRGFCTGPARAVRGEGVVYISRFDYAGRVDFGSTDPTSDESLIHWKKSPAALFQTVALLPPSKGATFAGCLVQAQVPSKSDRLLEAGLR